MPSWINVLLLALLASSSYATMDKGLVLYYDMNHIEGGVVQDQSGSGCNGQIVGAVYDRMGVAGGCLQFDGQSAYIRAAFNPTTSDVYSVSLWFKPDPLRVTELNYRNMIAMNRRYQIGFATNGPHYRFYSTCLNSSNYGYGALRADSGIFDIVPGRWYNVVLVVDGYGASYYLNGRSMGSISGPRPNRGDNELIVGGLNNSGKPGYFFPGWIDEVRLYDRALTEEEAATLFQRFAPTDLKPAAPASLGPSYTVHEGRIYERTENGGQERSLTEEETASLLQSVAAVQSAQISTETAGAVCEIGFSNAEKGDQDVTYFLPDETLHVRVRDTDAAAMTTNFSVQIFLRQSDTASASEKSTTILKAMERRRDGSYRIQLPLISFQPGPVWISVVGAENGSQPILMRTSQIQILQP